MWIGGGIKHNIGRKENEKGKDEEVWKKTMGKEFTRKQIHTHSRGHDVRSLWYSGEFGKEMWTCDRERGHAA